MTRNVNLLATAALAIGMAMSPAPAASAIDGTGELEPGVSDPCSDLEPGAASMEPPQALVDPDEVEDSDAHALWLAGIWTDP